MKVVESEVTEGTDQVTANATRMGATWVYQRSRSRDRLRFVFRLQFVPDAVSVVHDRDADPALVRYSRGWHRVHRA